MGKPNKIFFRCSQCGKLLIERMPNGLWHFVFGKRPDNQEGFLFPVDMFIHGSLKMRCLRRSCRTEHPDHWNVLNFFPGIMPVKEDRTNRPSSIEMDRKETIGDEKTSGVDLVAQTN